MSRGETFPELWRSGLGEETNIRGMSPWNQAPNRIVLDLPSSRPDGPVFPSEIRYDHQVRQASSLSAKKNGAQFRKLETSGLPNSVIRRAPKRRLSFSSVRTQREILTSSALAGSRTGILWMGREQSM